MTPSRRNLPLSKLAISIPETSRRFGWGLNRVRSMIASGQLLTVQIGDREMVSVVSIENLEDQILHGADRTAAAPEAPAATDPTEVARQMDAECAS